MSIRSILKITFSASSALLLAGCMPHLTAKQCQAINWYQMGFTDGSQGKPQRDLSQAILDCAKFKLKINQAGYTKGWKAGVRQYCQPGTAYQLGTQGKTYNHICPADLAPKFDQSWHRGLKQYCVPSMAYQTGRAGQQIPLFCNPNSDKKLQRAYHAGLRVHQRIGGLQNQINSLNDQINKLNSQIAAKRKEVNRIENMMSKPNTSTLAKQLAKKAIHDDYTKINDLQNQIKELTSQKNAYQSRLEKAENG